MEPKQKFPEEMSPKELLEEVKRLRAMEAKLNAYIRAVEERYARSEGNKS